MDEVQLNRLHGRFDTLLAQLAQMSERVARMEAQEESNQQNVNLFWQYRWPEQISQVHKLYEKIEALESKQASDHLILTQKIHEMAPSESKLLRGAKGTGLVAACATAAAVIRAIWDAFQQ